MWEDFKKFAIKGNVIDLAVAVVIGGAFGRIVTSLVNDIIMPILGIILGGVSFRELQLQYKDAVIGYGMFLQNIVDFFLIAFSIFIVIKIIRGMKKKEEPAAPAPPPVAKEIILLEEIRDILKTRKID
jgi:large conductance mechanosensitive channel